MGSLLSLCWRKRQSAASRLHDGDVVEEPKVYSWDKRAKLDAADFKFVNIRDETRAKESNQIAGQQFLIENCMNSTLLLMDHSASVTIDDCTGCTILIGPCKGSVFIRNCTDCFLVAICQQFRTRDCKNVHCLLHCATQPIIEASTSMKFGCLQLSYPNLAEQYDSAGVSIFNNLWSKVHDFTPVENQCNYSLLPEDVSLNVYIPEGVREQHQIKWRPSVIPETVGNRRKPSKEFAFLMFFTMPTPDQPEAALSLRQRCNAFLEEIRKFDSVHLVQSKEIDMQISDTERILETKRFSEVTSKGPVVSLELCGPRIHENCQQVLMSLPNSAKNFVYLADKDKGQSQSNNFYNYFDMQMGI